MRLKVFFIKLKSLKNKIPKKKQEERIIIIIILRLRKIVKKLWNKYFKNFKNYRIFYFFKRDLNNLKVIF